MSDDELHTTALTSHSESMPSLNEENVDIDKKDNNYMVQHVTTDTYSNLDNNINNNNTNNQSFR